jgi:hypothetical protein
MYKKIEKMGDISKIGTLVKVGILFFEMPPNNKRGN